MSGPSYAIHLTVKTVDGEKVVMDIPAEPGLLPLAELIKQHDDVPRAVDAFLLTIKRSLAGRD